MAAEIFEEKLTCAICLGLYRDPVTLPCGHNFCGVCIKDSVTRLGRECPECRELVPDCAALRRNVALSNVVELVQAAKWEPKPRPGAQPGALTELGPAACCPRHGRPLDLFCRTEGICVCSACTVFECRLHELALLEDERQEREAQLKATLETTVQQAARAKAELQKLQQRSSQIQSSACNLASMVSSKFSCLLRALETRQASALKAIEEAKTEQLVKAQVGEQQLQDHLEALARHDCKVQNLLGQPDDRTFLQESQLLAPPEPLRPLTPLQWNEDQQLGDLKKLLSQLDDLVLEEGAHPRVPAEAADLGPMEAPVPVAPVPSPVCPLRRDLWQNYRNLTFDPDSANRHLHLSCQNRKVRHRREPRDQASPNSFDLWQVQCTESFQAGRHYWEVRVSSHSVTLGVAYPELERNKQGTHIDNIGRGPSSWGLCLQEGGSQAWHNGEAKKLPAVSGRLLGMDLDLASGHLAFYSLEPQIQHLYTFHAIFTQPLYPVFWLLEGRTLALCHRPGSQEDTSEPN
ncbi:PREDICTED: tripartite motif-containing protein 65 [Chrysochloris asiatica]|uniref:Tripartite motif-containing protein 65 n=1 Tax=Chrysochloris asiatica TaxID=185453 RepID=A0A9B0TZV7_CHRAS|nr:PREDICTED: tripartite motif-containing protein 65 [Chrysochloris asiatica]